MSKRKIHEANINDRKIELFDNGEMVEKTQADGIHRFSLEGRNVCMDLFAINEGLSADGAQARDLIARIDMPIERFALFATDVSKHMLKMVAAVKAAKDKQAAAAAA